MSINLYRDVLMTYVTKKLPVANTPKLLDLDAQEFRSNFLKEELEEFDEAYARGDLVKASDAIIDLTVVALGTAVMMGLPFSPMWDAVLEANNSKIVGRTKRGFDVDLVKPEGWVGPEEELKRLLDESSKRGCVAVTLDKYPDWKDIAIEITDARETQIPLPFIEAAELAEKKGRDYNTGVDRDSYFPFGLQSYAHEIYKKSLRMISLLRTGIAPANEPIEDTLLDIMNYCCFALETMRKGEKDVIKP